MPTTRHASTNWESLGVVFTDLDRIDDGNGCGIDKPIKVSEALPGIKLKPDGVTARPRLRLPAG